MDAETASEALNEIAHMVLDKLDAGAVVVLAIVADESDNSIAMAVGSTGHPNSTRLLASAMPVVSQQLLEAAAKETVTRSEFFADGANNAN